MKIGVYVCECGVNIGATVDVETVAEYAKSLPYVVESRYYKYMCSDPGQELIKKDIKEQGLDRIVVASCSPRMHEPRILESIVLGSIRIKKELLSKQNL
jgi:heterodisulfide reductase subunit A